MHSYLEACTFKKIYSEPVYFLQRDQTDYFDHVVDNLSLDSLRSIKSVYDYRCVVSGEKPSRRIYILGLGVCIRGGIFCSIERLNRELNKLVKPFARDSYFHF